MASSRGLANSPGWGQSTSAITTGQGAQSPARRRPHALWLAIPSATDHAPFPPREFELPELSNLCMGTLEYWVLRIADSDLTWMGLNWMRPARTTHVGLWYILFSSFFLGLPGLLLGAAAIYSFCGRVSPTVWLALFSLVMLVEVPLHLLFAHYWNRRATKLAQDAALA